MSFYCTNLIWEVYEIIMFNDFLTILIFPRFSSFSLIVSLLNRYNVEHVRPTKTSVKPIYIKTSTLLIAAGNITTFAS